MFRSLRSALVLSGIALLGAGCGLDQTDVPLAYLKQAKLAVQKHDAAAATSAINSAENEWLGRNTPYGTYYLPIEPEALREMGRALQAISMQRWDDAEYYVTTAMTHPSMQTPGMF